MRIQGNMNAEFGSGSRVRSWGWVLLLALIVSVSAFKAQAGAPQQHKPAPLASFQCWLGVIGNQGAQDAVLLAKDFADPATLSVPVRPGVVKTAKPAAQRLSAQRMTHMLGTAGCLMLPGWRLRLTTLSLLAR